MRRSKRWRRTSRAWKAISQYVEPDAPSSEWWSETRSTHHSSRGEEDSWMPKSSPAEQQAAAAEAGTAAAAPAGRLRAIGVPPALLRIAGLLAAIVIIMIVFQVKNSAFLTTSNMLELVRAMSTLGIVALGETLVIIAGELDLSVGAVYGLCAMALGQMWIHGLSLYVALPAALALGVLLGVVNAFFTVIVRIPSFI